MDIFELVLIVAKCNVNIGATVTYNAAISY